MQMCNAEIMKKVKLLEQNKSDIMMEELRSHQVTCQNEKKPFEYGYSFTETREKISVLDTEVRKLKRLLNLSNATTIVAEFSMTRGECLVYLAQLNNEKSTFSDMTRKQDKTTNSTYGGVVEYTVLNYDKAERQAKLEWLKDTVAQLQIAIDRTNLTNMIEIE
jgi:hypothetical protein